MTFKYTQTNKSRAFTLIDMMVSVAIVSFLSSIVLFNITEGKNKAEDAHMIMESGQVAAALEFYKLESKGFTPLSVESVNTARGIMYTETTNEYKEAMNILVGKGYLQEVPTSPSGTAYAYGETLDGTQAVFAAKLKKTTTSKPSNKNSCSSIDTTPDTEETVTYDCDYIEPIAGPGTTPFNAQINAPATWDCTSVFNTYVNDKPYTCEFNEGTIPNICLSGESPLAEYRSSCLLEEGGITDFRSYTCPVESSDSSEPVCDGSSHSDYCTCI